MHARKLIYMGIVAAFSLAAAGAQAQGVVFDLSGKMTCKGKEYPNVAMSVAFWTDASGGSGEWGQFAPLWISRTHPDFPSPMAMPYRARFFPESLSPLKGTLALATVNWDGAEGWEYGGYFFSETGSLRITEDRNGFLKAEGKTMVFSDHETTGGVGEAVTATCEWKLQGVGGTEPY